MLHGEQAGFGPSRRADLRVNVLDVIADGLLGQVETARHVAVGAAAGDEPEDLHFPSCQPAWPLPPAANPVAIG